MEACAFREFITLLQNLMSPRKSEEDVVIKFC